MPATLIAAFEIIGMSTALATIAANMVITFAVSAVFTRLFSPKIPSGTNQSLPDQGVRQQIPPSTTNSLPIVYGDAYLGGTFVDAALSQDQKYMWYVLAISSISPNGQFSFDTTNFYYGDRKIAFSGTSVASLTDGSGNVDTSIGGNFNIWLFTSSASGTITPLNGALQPYQVMAYSASDQSTVPSALAWASTNRQMNGLAFAIVKLHYNQQAGITGLQPITFRCSHYLNSQGCAKAGDVWVDYLSNTNYGGAVPSNLIDTTSATALNTYGDTTIPYTNNVGVASTMPRYRINGVLDTATNVLDNIDKILIAADSWMAYNAAQGQWSIVINQTATSSFSFTDNNIIGEITVGLTDINQSVNQIEARFPNGLNKDISDFVALQTSSGLLYANEPVNKQTIDFNLVNNNVTVQYLANKILKQAREDLLVSFASNYQGIQVNAGDVVTVTNTAYGWSSKLFRVMQVNEASLPDGSLGASFQMIEYNPTVYDVSSITQYQPAPNSSIPFLGYFGALAAPTVTDQQPNAAVPSFSVNCVLPSVGQILSVTLFYTNVASPSTTDWVLWGVLTASNSSPFTNGTTLKFPHIGLPTDTYYFAFLVGNNSGNSALSAQSSSYVWSPNPSTSAVAGTFISQFSPQNLSVPYDGTTATLTGIIPTLYGNAAGGSIDFVGSQTDSDSLFVNNTWRIGGSSTTGYGDIVKSGITIGNPSDGGFYALFPTPTAMSTNPATIVVPVRYKGSTGVVTQGANATLQLVYAVKGATGTAGANANKNGIAYLYQWATTTPSNPTGYSTFTWASLSNSSYTGGNSWTTSIPANPATAGIALWQAAIAVVDVTTAVTSSVNWASGFSISNISQNGVAGTNGANGANGANGTQTAIAAVFQWALTIPAAPTGTATYTWASGTFTPTPSGWTLSPTTSPSVGYTLWQASVRLLDTATVTTSTINWTSSTISAVGYAGTNGTNGTNGSQGASSRICYTKTTLSALASTPTTITTTGSTSFPPNNSWGTGTVWQSTAPTIVAGESVYQSDGFYDPSTSTPSTVWNVPYLSTLKVGSLSAISANLGSITSGNIVLNSSSYIEGGQTAFNTGSGFFLGYDTTTTSAYKFSIGNPSAQYLTWDGSYLRSSGMPKQAGLQIFSTAGTYTFNVPVGIYVLYVTTIIGGGGGGAYGGNIATTLGSAGGGGAGEIKTNIRIPSSGQFSGNGTEQLTIVVGQGGLAGTTYNTSIVALASAARGGNGYDSSVSLVGGATYVTALAGKGGYQTCYGNSSTGYGYYQGQSGNQFTALYDATNTLEYCFDTGTWASYNGGSHMFGRGNIVLNRSVSISTISGTGGNGAIPLIGSNPQVLPQAGQSGIVVLQW